MRRHVKWCSNYRLHLCIITVQTFGKTKVSELTWPCMKKNVGRFEISMNNSTFVKVFCSFHEVSQVLFSLNLRNFSFFVEKFEKITILAKFSDNIHIISGLVDIIETNNVLVRYFFHNLDLRLNVLDIVCIGEYLLVDHFHSHRESCLYLSP